MLCTVCTVIFLLILDAGLTVDGAVNSSHYIPIGCHTHTFTEQGVQVERCHGLYTLERTWDEAVARCQGQCTSLLAGVKAGRVHLCRVAGSTV